MKLSLSILAVVSTILGVSVYAAPAPVACQSGLCSKFYGRDVDGIVIDNLVARAKKSSGANKAAISKGVQAVQKKQAARITSQQKKKAANVKTQNNQAASVNKKVDAFRAQSKKGVASTKQINKQSDKIRASEKGRVAAQSRMDHKAKKTQDWAAKKKSPAAKATTKQAAAARRTERKKTGAPSPANQASKKVRPTKQEKNNVKQRFQAAKKKLDTTKGLPGRKDTVSVGAHKTDGRAVRQATFNSYLHNKSPVGHNKINKQPKPFNNKPYSATHGEPALRNKKAIPQNGKEYPIINKSPNGWTGGGAVGPLRAVTYKQGGQRHVSVLGHDDKRKGSKDDHYVATVTPAKTKGKGKRELSWEFDEEELV